MVQYHRGINDSKWTRNNNLSKRDPVQDSKPTTSVHNPSESWNVTAFPLLPNFSGPKPEIYTESILLTGLLMQAGHWDSGKEAYLTTKDVEPVRLHSSCH